MIIKWPDKKPVFALSTIHNSSMSTLKQKHINERMKYPLSLEYHDAMGRVALADSGSYNYGSIRK